MCALAKLVATLSKEDGNILYADSEWIDAQMQEIWGNITVSDVIPELPEHLVEYGVMSIYDAGLGPFLKASLSHQPSERPFTAASLREVRCRLTSSFSWLSSRFFGSLTAFC
jgi:hypothetical protein